MSISFSGINIGGTPSGGGSGTSDHSQLTNLSYANSGHTGFLSDEKYIPAGTKITVGSDKDYQTIQTAYNSLEGKWSDGTVTIQIDDGTYNEQLIFNKSYDIPKLLIKGTSTDNTIINLIPTQDYSQIAYFSAQKIRFTYLTFSSNATRYSVGLNIDNNSNIELGFVKIKNIADRAITLSSGSIVTILDTVEIANDSTQGNIAIYTAMGANVFCSWNKNIKITNFATGLKALAGGMNALNSPQLTFTNVSTQYSPALNSTDAGTGWNFDGQQ